MPAAGILLDENTDQGSKTRDESEVVIPAVVASIILVIIRVVVKVDFSSSERAPEPSVQS